MSQENGQQTIGQEFAERWMSNRNPGSYNSTTLLRDLIAAVDEYVQGQPDDRVSVIREVALEAAGGDDNFFKEITIDGRPVRITARQILRSPGLLQVADRHHLGGPTTWQFPV